MSTNDLGLRVRNAAQLAVDEIRKLIVRMGPRNSVLVITPALLLVALAGRAALVHDDAGHIPSARVKRGAVTIKVTESGELRARDQVTISAVNDKQILWLAPEGKVVQAGDTLVVFESEKYVISRSEAQSSLLVARADLDKAANNLEAQRSKEEAARKRYEGLPALAKKGYVMESEVEAARLGYQELRSVTRSYQAAVDAAAANVQRAARGVAQEDRKLRQGVIWAPRAGVVVYATTGNAEDAHKITVGMTPFEGMDLMYLPDVSSMLVDTQISEIDLSKIRLGQSAQIQLDAFPGVKFKGTVETIANLAKRKINRATSKATGAKVFDVTVRVLEQDPRLKPGLTAMVDIIASQHQDVVQVPLEAVFYDEEEHPLVYVKTRGHVQARVIEFTESNERVAVVTKNLQPGDQVLLGRPSTP